MIGCFLSVSTGKANRQTVTFTPDPSRVRWYTPGRRPYIEFTAADEQKLHARVLGWQEDMILVEYPVLLIDRFNHGQRRSVWIHKSAATRIRREDALWSDLEDDYPWHEREDERIKYRPDPWSIYGQEFPGAR